VRVEAFNQADGRLVDMHRNAERQWRLHRRSCGTCMQALRLALNRAATASAWSLLGVSL